MLRCPALPACRAAAPPAGMHASNPLTSSSLNARCAVAAVPQVRHLESMIRMSEARAAMHLREHVNDDDIDCAIRWVPAAAVVWRRVVGSQRRLLRHPVGGVARLETRPETI